MCRSLELDRPLLRITFTTSSLFLTLIRKKLPLLNMIIKIKRKFTPYLMVNGRVGWIYLISHASWKNGFNNHTGWLSSHYPKSKTWAIVHQLNGLHVLPVNLKGINTSLPTIKMMYENLQNIFSSFLGMFFDKGRWEEDGNIRLF